MNTEENELPKWQEIENLDSSEATNEMLLEKIKILAAYVDYLYKNQAGI